MLKRVTILMIFLFCVIPVYVHSADDCLEFPQPMEEKNPWVNQWAKFEAFDADGNPLPQVQIQDIGGFIGLNCGHKMEIGLTNECLAVELSLVHFNTPATAEAYNADGTLVDTASMSVKQGVVETVTVSGGGEVITSVVITAPQDETLLVKICCLKEPGEPSGDCIEFLKPTEIPNPWEYEWAKFEVFDHTDTPWPAARVQEMSGFTGLNCGHKLYIELLRKCPVVELYLVHFSKPGKVVAYDADGGVVDVVEMSSARGIVETVTVSGSGEVITSVVVSAPDDEMLLLKICCVEEPVEDDRRIRVADYVKERILGGQFTGQTLWMTETPLDESHVARDINPEVQDIPFPFPKTWLVMIDDEPEANWGHKCHWLFINDNLEQHTDPIEKDFAPRVFSEFGKGVEVAFACTDLTGVICPDLSVTLKPWDIIDIVRDECLYAVLISGGAYPHKNYNRYRQNLSSMYTILRNCGYARANIYVYYADGASLDLDNADGDNDHSTGNDVTDSSSEANIRGRIQDLCGSLDPDRDTLFIYTSNHGSNNRGLCLWDFSGNGQLENDEIYSPAELAADTANCNVCRLFMLFDQCYSGEFLDMASDGDHDNSAIYVAATAHESSWGREYLAQWEQNDPKTTTLNDMHDDVETNGGLTSTAGFAEGTVGNGDRSLCDCCEKKPNIPPIVRGQILVRIEPSIIDKLRISIDKDGLLRTEVAELDELIKQFGVAAMTPVFKDPNLEEETGVILASYYALTVGKDTDVFDVSQAFGELEVVQRAHPVPVAVDDPQLEEIAREIDPDLQVEPPPEGPLYIPNELILVFQPEAVEKINLQVDPETKFILTGIGEVDQANRQFQIISMDRVFPEAQLEEKNGVTLNIYYFVRSQLDSLDQVGGVAVASKQYSASESIRTAHEVPIIVDDITRPNDYFVDINGDGTSSAATGVSAASNNMREQWALELIHAYEAWDIAQGQNVTIAINDSGVEVNHPDLTGNILRNAAGDVVGDTSLHDGRHGTCVAGIAAAVADNSTGVAGVAYQSRIMPLDRSYDPTINWVVGGVRNIQRATDMGADVINMSWHFEATATYSATAFDWLEAAIDYASASNVVLVCSAGNRPYSASLSLPYDGWPALYDQTTYVDPVTGVSVPMTVISVGNVSETDTRWWTSNYGAWLDIMAPGAHTTSTDRVGGNGYNTSATMSDYTEFSGTSSSSPHVAGATAVLLSIDSALTPNDIRNILIGTADKIGGVVYDAAGFNTFYGFGRLNLYRAVQEITPDIAIRPWDSHWNSPDIWVDNDADGVEDSPEKGRINTLYAGFRNVGNDDASNFNVTFEYAPIGIGASFQLIGTVNYPGTLSPGSSDSVSIAWDLPDIAAYAGIDHFCVKVSITDVTNDANLANNVAQNNFFDVGAYEPGVDYAFLFIIGNPYEYLLRPIIRIELPKGWQVIYDDDIILEEMVLKEGEERRISGRVEIPEDADNTKDGVVSFTVFNNFQEVMGGVAFRFRGKTQPAEKPAFKLDLVRGINLMDVPLEPGTPWHLSDLASFIGKELSYIVWHSKTTGQFISYFSDFPVDSPANKAVMGGDGYIVFMNAPKTVTFVGQAWSNTTVPAAPSLLTGTATLVLDGLMFGDETGELLEGVKVIMTNLRTGETVHGVTGEFGIPGRYTLTFADITGRSIAKPGDMLRLSVLDVYGQPVIEPITHPVNRDELETGLIDIPRLRVPLRPRKTELLANYPNPFNPETWMPFRLSEATEVSIDIYNALGQIIQTLHLGHTASGNYLNRMRAAHWDGNNNAGESVASGVYFYVLRAGKFTASRKMIVLK